MADLAKKLRTVQTKLEELKTAAYDRFADLDALGQAVADLGKGARVTLHRLGSISVYLAEDGSSEVLTRIDELSDLVNGLIKQLEGDGDGE